MITSFDRQNDLETLDILLDIQERVLDLYQRTENPELLLNIKERQDLIEKIKEKIYKNEYKKLPDWLCHN